MVSCMVVDSSEWCVCGGPFYYHNMRWDWSANCYLHNSPLCELCVRVGVTNKEEGGGMRV